MIRERVSTARGRALLVGASLLAACVAHAAGDLEYPGASPGTAKIDCRAGRIDISNAVISISWTWANGGIRPASLRDEQAGQNIALGGEVFQVVLADGQRYAASGLAMEGEPRVREIAPETGAARLAARIAGQQAEMRLRSADGRLRLVWRALLHDGGNYVRQEVDVTPVGGDRVVREIVWMDEEIPGARVMGRVDGSPIIAGTFFFGCEDPHALAADGRASFRLRRDAPLLEGETLTQSFAVGVLPRGQMRRGFLHYLERERAHPYRPFLHYNSWYDISWRGSLFNEATSLEAIGLFGERFIRAHGVVMDAMVFDDGWDDPKTLWQFNGGFPRGFAPLMAPCKQYGTRLGVWLSPFGGYGELKKQRLQYGREQGYEINPTGFSLAGPKYYAAFKGACVRMIREYGVNHFKFDGIAAGTQANGGADYVLDTEAMRRLMLELRREDPNLYINLTTGSWPSPFWLRYADSIWRQGHDMGLAGKGPKQQQWLTYRDQETYRNIVGKGPLFPLNSLMTQGVAYSRSGMAGDPTFDSAGFKDDVRAFFGSGTGLQELYIQPGKLAPGDWAVLAEAAKWSRANADVLVDTHWIGGDPSKLEPYGYASWSRRKGAVMLRNPDDRPHDFPLDVGAAFELPTGAPTKYSLRSPWAEDARDPALTAEAGRPLSCALAPFQIVIFDAVPQAGAAR
ncbi:MAG TPA: enterotoxin [Verrucomicrobiae bacterium]|nr:enterotoxin [Verrucomicrobiae bacterium]